MAERYALYWAPPPGSALDRLGQTWFGVDAETGASAEPDRHGLNVELWRRAVASPRRYGFHATMKAPFRPAADVTETDLSGALSAFCSARRAFETGPLRLAVFNRYLALVPTAPLADLDWLASECVTHFDRFRAPLNGEDRARRPRNLPPDQAELMEQFGYPYIFSHFAFHITLAGPLEAAELEMVRDALTAVVVPFSREPFRIAGLCLFGDPGNGAPFRLLCRCPFGR